ncbi:hypothetical protein ACTXT7_010402 [Hymenolepis weldensis]
MTLKYTNESITIPLEVFDASTFERVGGGLPKSLHIYRDIRLTSEALSSCIIIQANLTLTAQLATRQVNEYEHSCSK